MVSSSEMACGIRCVAFYSLHDFAEPQAALERGRATLID
jgi:hypothetical protein